MFLRDYVADLTDTVNDYVLTGFILSSDMNTDFRGEKIGLIKGSVVFIDGSTLFFKEYIDLRYEIDKKTYSFHYQDRYSQLLFRYDNALHKPALGFDDHKHIGSEILPTEVPNLRAILEEIITGYFASY